ncbi:putative glycosyltransferase [Heterostelium album PN500]|uniref:Putative glycosyltransferase n=1 Tax=Heterostelium pallidum (strain ATCC 26659 / Pp 5 / PN500) TaxID=670386 RepID=D3BEJ0_HETP5|nr:putative glycosyltransferase [Heterostelium album PN500]EFA80321.1 putative glycosyltransferase [Heterostelium album PN500]|eukprot:XP_020432441.1 putative glycosyltransferase [Heterostelium album PN500]
MTNSSSSSTSLPNLNSNNSSSNILDSVASNIYIFDSIHINNDVKEYRVTRKSKTIIYPFDYILYIILALHIFYLVINDYFVLNSFMFILLSIVIIIRLFLKLFIVREESLTVIRELGVQLRKKYYFIGESTRFIEKPKIQSIIINEGISRYRVTFYMAFLVEGKQKMVLAFDDLIPRINVLLKIYRGTRSLMYGEPEE